MGQSNSKSNREEHSYRPSISGFGPRDSTISTGRHQNPVDVRYKQADKGEAIRAKHEHRWYAKKHTEPSEAVYEAIAGEFFRYFVGYPSPKT